MSSKYMAASGCLLAALALGVAACGDSDDDAGAPKSGETASKSLTIYSSVPLQGASRIQTEALVNGAKLAVEQAGNKAGSNTRQVRPAGRLHGAGRQLDA